MEGLKRAYKSRKDEFLDLSTDQLLAKREEIKLSLKDIDSQLLANTDKTPESVAKLQEDKKEITNYRTRLYARLRKLGVNCSEARSSLAAQKKALKGLPTEVSTDTVPPVSPPPTI